MQHIDIKKLKLKILDAGSAVQMIDLSLIKMKMVDTFGWSMDIVEVMEEKYRKFLMLQHALRALNSPFNVVPDRIIDEIWHMHILDTKKYAEDCNLVFGEIIHHDPYFGMMGEDDRSDWIKQAQQCNLLWYEIFGTQLYPNMDDDDDRDAYFLDREFHKTMSSALLMNNRLYMARCRTQCKPVKCK